MKTLEKPRLASPQIQEESMSFASPSFCCRDDEAVNQALLGTLKCNDNEDFQAAVKKAKVWNLAATIVEIAGHVLAGVLFLGTGFLIGFAIFASAAILEILVIGFLGIVLASGCLFVAHVLKESFTQTAFEDLVALDKRA